MKLSAGTTHADFRNFRRGIVYFLIIACFLFVAVTLLLGSSASLPGLLNVERWSSISDSLNLILGLPIAFSGAYVAIAIASKATDIAAKQQAQETRSYYEGLHEQLIDNYYEITQSANRLVSSANRFEEAFHALLHQETAGKYGVLNFIDEDHRRTYIQEMLSQNRNRITDVLTAIHADIKVHIGQLVSAIDQAFKYSVVNETWSVSVREPGRRSLLLEACRKGFFQGPFGDGDASDWLSDAKMEISERLDLQEIGHSLSESRDAIHPLLPFCLYVSELNDFRNDAGRPVRGLSFEVLLAGYFLMSNATRASAGNRAFFNSGVLFLVDLIDHLPRPEHIKLAFSHRLQKTESALAGVRGGPDAVDLHQSALEAYAALSNDNKTLFTVLAENIQLTNYSPRISKTRVVLEKVLDTYAAGDPSIPLLRINFELMSKAVDPDDALDFKQKQAG
jgi:hypothetical protein